MFDQDSDCKSQQSPRRQPSVISNNLPPLYSMKMNPASTANSVGKVSSKSKVASICPFSGVQIPVLNFNNKMFQLDSGSEGTNRSQHNRFKESKLKHYNESQQTPKEPENTSL